MKVRRRKIPEGQKKKYAEATNLTLEMERYAKLVSEGHTTDEITELGISFEKITEFEKNKTIQNRIKMLQDKNENVTARKQEELYEAAMNRLIKRIQGIDKDNDVNVETKDLWKIIEHYETNEPKPNDDSKDDKATEEEKPEKKESIFKKTQ